MSSPDIHSRGFLKTLPNASRYENTSLDPEDVAARLSALIPPSAQILDVGCGTGSISLAIQNLTGGTLIGVEPDEVRAAIAKDRGINVFNGFLDSAFLRENGPFDVIVFADVLEHLADPWQMILVAKEGLKPGGSIVASVPNVAHWFVRVELLFGNFNYEDSGLMDATHLRWFTRNTIQTFFANAGLVVTSVGQTTNIGLPQYSKRLPWRWLRLSLRRRLVSLLARTWPSLFGCQHIVRATLPNAGIRSGSK